MEGGPAWPVEGHSPGSGTGILPVNLEKPVGVKPAVRIRRTAHPSMSPEIFLRHHI